MRIEELLEMARANEAWMDGTDLVYGVFPDPGKQSGYNAMILKGGVLIKQIASGSEPRAISVTAVRTVNRNMAIAAGSILGDGGHDWPTSKRKVH